ncbi:MAG: hypothetical protein GXO43_08180, partial [Crenarchaeota archaeon]|nr:hypothetical protein [Thermoproteota archaeon]
MDVTKYYSDPRIQEEIAKYLKKRWVGIEGENRKWVRWENDKPLVIKEPGDVSRIIKRYGFIKPRSIYGTIEIFKN